MMTAHAITKWRPNGRAGSELCLKTKGKAAPVTSLVNFLFIVDELSKMKQPSSFIPRKLFASSAL
jgi:hypothetical protein